MRTVKLKRNSARVHLVFVSAHKLESMLHFRSSEVTGKPKLLYTRSEQFRVPGFNPKVVLARLV